MLQPQPHTLASLVIDSHPTVDSNSRKAIVREVPKSSKKKLHLESRLRGVEGSFLPVAAALATALAALVATTLTAIATLARVRGLRDCRQRLEYGSSLCRQSFTVSEPAFWPHLAWGEC